MVLHISGLGGASDSIANKFPGANAAGLGATPGEHCYSLHPRGLSPRKAKQKQQQKAGVIHSALYIIKKIVSITIILKVIILPLYCIILFQNVVLLLLTHMLESLLLLFLL